MGRSDRQELRSTERFEIVSRLGEGGMGVVYVARDRERDVTVALKTVRELTPERLLRFKNEFRALQDVAHPNLVHLGDLVESEGAWFFSMELVDGCDFLSWVRPTGAAQDCANAETVGAASSTTNQPTEAPAHAAGSTLLHRDHSAPLDELRLRRALAQLASGLAALHQAGQVHRDLKPSNILVTADGRVVILDFGLVGRAHQRAGAVVGTVGYMAPEQAADRAIGPAADWYSVGVLLYEALVGRWPIEGSQAELLARKQDTVPIPADQLAPDAPADLAALCTELLHIEPERRPPLEAILTRLGVMAARDPLRASATGPAAFVGRGTELAMLRSIYRSAGTGRASVVIVHGESGVGKTALVRRFLELVTAESPPALVLEGRCYERESVPYKAFDGVIDELGAWLSRLPPEVVASILPDHVAVLAEMFPGLRGVAPIAAAAGQPVDDLPRSELRARGFAALRELIGSAALRYPLVVVLDDVQWADRDSLALLRELLRAPAPPPMMLIATLRTPTESAVSVDDIVRIAEVGAGCHPLRVEGLPRGEAEELVRSRAHELGPDVAMATARLASESGGHPLYIDELIRFTVASRGADDRRVRLDDALWSRIGALADEPRRLVELVAVAGEPRSQRAIADAAAFAPDQLARWIASLRAGNLLRTTGTRPTDLVEAFHDRVRAAILAHLDAATLRAHHGRLACALEACGEAAPEALARHWRGAGDTARAYRHARVAAAQAADGLAFARAARLYALCVELLAPGAPEVAELQLAIGDALSHGGRGREAADAYLTAAALGGRHALEARRRAAEQLLTSGHIDSGLEVLRLVLDEFGLALPKTPRRAMASLIVNRARLRLRGLAHHERPAAQLAPAELARVDLCWSVAIGLGLIDTIRGAEFQVRHIRQALDCGEPYRVARALALEGSYLSAGGNATADRVDEVLARARALAERLGDAHAIGLTHLTAGIAGLCQGRWRAAVAAFAQAETIPIAHGRGSMWERDSARILSLWAQWYLGDLGAMAQRAPMLYRDALERGDLYAATSFGTALLPLVYLAEDRADAAATLATSALARWSQQGFYFQHYSHLWLQAQVELYRGGDAALGRLDALWPTLERSLLLTVQQTRLEALHLRARAALVAAVAASGRAGAKLLARARTLARQVLRERTAWADPMAVLIVAAIARIQGDHDTAHRQLQLAIDGFDATDQALYAAAARFQLGRLIGGVDGDPRGAAGAAAMTARGIRNPLAMARMLVPGFR